MSASSMPPSVFGHAWWRTWESELWIEPRRRAQAAGPQVRPHRPALTVKLGLQLLMDSAAHKLIESATHRTLHAHSFARSSSQASIVLTDLLSRYLALLSSTCAKYAQHAGRTRMTARDALGALDELGVSLEELSEYCSTEGKDLGRYAIYSARRVEDLNEFKCQLCCELLALHLYLIFCSPTGRWTEAGS